MEKVIHLDRPILLSTQCGTESTANLGVKLWNIVLSKMKKPNSKVQHFPLRNPNLLIYF